MNLSVLKLGRCDVLLKIQFYFNTNLNIIYQVLKTIDHKTFSKLITY